MKLKLSVRAVDILSFIVKILKYYIIFIKYFKFSYVMKIEMKLLIFTRIITINDIQ